MIFFVSGFLLNFLEAWHDSKYTKIRHEQSRNLYPEMDLVFNWSFEAKMIKTGRYIGWMVLLYLGDPQGALMAIYGFTSHWFLLFDQVHWFLVNKKFLSWREYWEKHIIHRAWQYAKYRFA